MFYKFSKKSSFFLPIYGHNPINIVQKFSNFVRFDGFLKIEDNIFDDISGIIAKSLL